MLVLRLSGDSPTGAWRAAARPRAPAEAMPEALRVAIVAEHASARFGGEAALPLHWFRVLRSRGIETWLVSHARTRAELEALFPDEPRLLFIEDSAFHKAMDRIAQWVSPRISHFTLGFASRLSVQAVQRRIVRRLVRERRIDLVHQPIPVSPREPSLLADLGVPVVIGPMNGGMTYPPGLGRAKRAERLLIVLGRIAAALLHRIIPGKRRAALLLVANARTERALPPHHGRVVELVENGVDLQVFDASRVSSRGVAGGPARDGVATFVFMGRLVDWKRVDLLLDAVARAAPDVPLRLRVIGDGDERAALEGRARMLGLLPPRASGADASTVEFTGWLTQAECAAHLSAAHALVLPSVLECGGAVVLEAMAMGRPVIATAWGGPLDYLDESCGVLVHPSSPEALVTGLADAMRRLARSPEDRERLGRAGREKVQRLYDWEVKADRMLELYRDAVRAGAGR
jgi:glycosyltransferase involved in cell wall biosynthesis